MLTRYHSRGRVAAPWPRGGGCVLLCRRISRQCALISILSVVCVALVGCPNSPLQDIITGEATTYLGPESLKDVPAGVIFTTPNFPQTTKQEYLEALDLARRSFSFISYVWMWPDGEQGLVHATKGW